MFVKICGITNEEDALLAVALGADALGFVFAPSTRQVTQSRVAAITSRLPRHVLTVGVFKDEAPKRVVELVHMSGLRYAQLHGHESPAACLQVRSQIGGVIKAFTAGSEVLSDASDYSADMILDDSPTPGSGKVFDWGLLEGVPAGAPPVLLAGGLDASNVASAIEVCRPFGVDVSSGVEASPGRKDPRKLRAFIQAARSVPPIVHIGSEAFPYDWLDE